LFFVSYWLFYVTSQYLTSGLVAVTLSTIRNGNAALITIDPQRFYVTPAFNCCGNNNTIMAVNRAVDLKIAFNERSLLSYVVYADEFNMGIESAGIVGVAILSQDIPVQKRTNVAFYQTCMQQELRRKNLTTIIADGVNLAVCVKEYIVDAMNDGVEVYLAHDGVANGENLQWNDPASDILYLQSLGANFVSTSEVTRILDAQPG